MNRNNERHFNQIPKLEISRTRFKRDQNILTTFDAGKLIPFYVDEVIPGDTFSVTTSAIIRMTTPKYPVMDDAFIDFYYFFVPNRIVWDDFKKFMGEADEEAWAPTKTYSVPKIYVNAKPTAKMPETGTVLDYMGVPTYVSNPFQVNALPVRAYVKIWNEFFRDQNVENAALNSRESTKGPGTNYYSINGDKETVEKDLRFAWTGAYTLPVNKFHDYFTSCLPYPQRGPEVSVGALTNTPLAMFEDETLTTPNTVNGNNILNLIKAGATESALDNTLESVNPIKVKGLQVNGSSISGAYDHAWLGAMTSTQTATTINQLRQAFSVQQYYEALARGGSRYREQVRSLFGTIISDKTVQVPEYLGGGRYHVNMNQIVQTSGGTANTTQLGETGAMSITPVNEASFTKSFEEHGFVIGVMCVRHNRTYQQGLERFWSRSDRLDYYFPQFAHLGEQPVKKKEIMLTGTSTDEETFGYQEAWADYRMKPNRVSGKMRSNAQGTLDFWHYADNYENVPTLSQEWMAEGKSEIARTLIVQDEPQFFGAIRVSNNTTRPMPLYSVPGLNKM
nr:major head protein [Microvirus sp.]